MAQTRVISPILGSLGTWHRPTNAAPEPKAETSKDRKPNSTSNKRRISALEAKIAALETQIADLEKTLGDPDVYARLKPTETAQMGRDLSTKRSELDCVLSEWELASQ